MSIHITWPETLAVASISVAVAVAIAPMILKAEVARASAASSLGSAKEFSLTQSLYSCDYDELAYKGAENSNLDPEAVQSSRFSRYPGAMIQSDDRWVHASISSPVLASYIGKNLTEICGEPDNPPSVVTKFTIIPGDQGSCSGIRPYKEWHHGWALYLAASDGHTQYRDNGVVASGFCTNIPNADSDLNPKCEEAGERPQGN